MAQKSSYLVLAAGAVIFLGGLAFVFRGKATDPRGPDQNPRGQGSDPATADPLTVPEGQTPGGNGGAKAPGPNGQAPSGEGEDEPQLGRGVAPPSPDALEKYYDKDMLTSDGRLEMHEGVIVVGLKHLIKHADRIVVGQIIDAKPQWNAERTEIFTSYTVQVEQGVRGLNGEDKIKFKVIGGQVGDDKLQVSHQPKFTLGDEGVFFITDDPERKTSLVGDEQGSIKFKRPAPDQRIAFDGFGRPIYGVKDDDRFDPKTDDPSNTAPVSADEIITRVKDMASK